ncbi:MAG: trehalose-phosphatase [SAR202 cluster bacterium Io17-Chloro-G9]|nr:MAG: trehalose-phosphatase [SAR202 cluster bacterium Io17-Chloro-G9]
MPHLLNVWHSVSRRLGDAAQVLLLFDYDGTLTPIVPEPGEAKLPPVVTHLLEELAAGTKFLVGVVTGRSLADIQGRIGIPGLIYAGNHGLEIQGPGLDFVHEAAVRLAPIQEPIAVKLQEAMAGLTGAIVEPKGLTLTVHYRMTPDSQLERVERAFASTVAPYVDSGSVKITAGKKVLEVRPNVDWDKGKAIAKLSETFPGASQTLFFGDDLTDEDGFKVVQDSGGIAVFVGPARQPTVAWHRLDSPGEVGQVLGLLTQL